MLPNLLFLLLTLLVLYFIGMLWLRHSLFNQLREVEQHRLLMLKDMAKRRDTVPVLLEGWRDGQEPTDAWRQLVEKRALFHGPSSLEQELEFEHFLNAFLAQHSCKNVNFLDAKKDIQEHTRLIEQEKGALRASTEAYNAHRKQFPYSLASAIFGLRDAPIL